jgi:ligand-binding sensor domain-containing protein
VSFFPGEYQWVEVPDALPGDYYGLSQGTRGDIWAAGWNERSLYSYKDGQWRKEYGWEESNGIAMAVATDHNGGAWLVFGSTEIEAQLVHVIDGEARQHPFPSASAIESRTPLYTHLLVDHRNRLWLGYQDGLYLLEDAASAILTETWGGMKSIVNDARPSD